MRQQVLAGVFRRKVLYSGMHFMNAGARLGLLCFIFRPAAALLVPSYFKGGFEVGLPRLRASEGVLRGTCWIHLCMLSMWFLMYSFSSAHRPGSRYS